MDWATIYGILVGVVLAITWAARDHVVQKLAILLLMAWASTNFVVDHFGFDRAPLLTPSIDAAIAVLVALLGYLNRSRVAAVVFGLYLAVGLTHVGAFILRQETTYTYYAILNLLFLAQLITVGGTGARLAVRYWSASGGERASLDGSRWAGMG